MKNELIERVDEYLHADANGMLSDSTPDDLLADCKAEIEQLREINASLRTHNEGLDAECARLEAAGIAPPDGFAVVPIEPNDEMCSGLARNIVMWWCFDKPTGTKLYSYLKGIGEEIPEWLIEEIPNENHVPPKGAVAASIYKAMIAATQKENASD